MAPTTESEIKTVLVIIAMEAEAKPMVEKLGLTKDEPSRIPPPATCVTFSGKHGGLNVHIACNGVCKEYGIDNVGTVPATLTAYLGIEAFKPDIVISAGTAGGFKEKGGEIGDVYHSTSTINHDRKIAIPVFTAYGMDSRPSHPCPNMVKALGLKGGVVSTGNRFDKCEVDMETMAENSAAVKEMEAAAVSWVCSLSGTPCFALKALTDIVDGDRPSHDEFLENLATAASHLKDAVVGAVEFMDGKSLKEL
eukprot:CAMPEP_0117662892 /NCGR_PEP_ID=MMETSP0804-20121206/8293_1 /TAXON_ID=1074897 /ORGANISM="Tetraselmis astigmatica, Strain CCMP880" /LENGTH=250 /DNA_ID=CAMNT_0005469817 /DNA_START=62 /DNA_END=814 /DNA_ORIENTATION=+